MIELQLQILSDILEILLLEYRVTKENEVLNEVQFYFQMLIDTSYKEKIYSFYFRAMIINSKIQIAKGNFDIAEKEFKNILEFIEEEGLTGYKQKLKVEQQEMLKQFRLMKDMIQQNVNLADRIEKINLEDYIKLVYKSPS